MTIFYVLAAIIIVGLTTLIWRRLQGSDNWDRDASFFVDLLAMGATALIVGVLAFNQLQAAPDEAEPSLAQRPVVTEAVPSAEAEVAEEEPEVETEEEEDASPTPRTTSTPRATRTPRATTEATEEAEPTEEAEADPTEEATATTEPTETVAAGTQSYTVKSGDRLAAIATAYGVTVADIEASNPGLDVDNLQVGQVLTIPTAQAPSGTPVPSTGSSSGSGTSAPRTYTVQSGDYLNTIAADFGVTAAQIIAVNPGLDADNLQVGQVINLP